MPISIQNQKPLHNLTTFGIGGPASYFIELRTLEDCKEALLFCQEKSLPYFVLGKGSNILFDDKGFNGVVLHNKIDFCEWKGPQVCVGAGYSFSLLGSQTARKGLTGLEFASGIPGSVGGAIFMNAGANGKETFEHLESVDFFTDNGDLLRLTKNELTWGYRNTCFHKMKGIIVGATFLLLEEAFAREKQLKIIQYRLKTQPYNEKSAGCIFRNPSCEFAGALIEKAGLKGIGVGGAKVSSLHANFIINSENATAQDVLNLIDHIKAKVKETSDLELESEVRVIPYDA